MIGRVALGTALGLVAACSGPGLPRAAPRAEPPPTTSAGEPPASGVPVPPAAPGARFSVSAGTPAVSLATLHYARATAIRAHPSGDVVIAGCTEGSTDLLRGIEDRRILGFVARVEPATGTFRWVRHFELGEAAFENHCRTHRPVGDRGATVHGSTLLVVGSDGGIHVAALVDESRPAAPPAGSPPAGAVVFSLDPATGVVRWHHSLAGTFDPVVVTHLLHAGTGVDAVVRRAAPDGLDTHDLVRFDDAGHASTVPLVRSVPMPGRRAPCHPGASGCRIGLEHVLPTEGGELVVYGTVAGVQLSLGTATIPSPADGVRSEGFWAVLDRDGTPRSARGGAPVLTGAARAHGHHVLAVVHPPSHVERLELIDATTGRGVRWPGADPAWPIAETLRLHEEHRGRLTGATITVAGTTHPLAPPPSSPLTPGALRRVVSADPGGPAPEVVRLPNGALAAVFTIGNVQIGGATAASTHRMVPCHPGPAGEETSQPPGCREPLDRPSALLVSWPPSP